MTLLSFFTRRQDNRAGSISPEARYKAECAALERDLDDRLAIRRQDRAKRSCAARKGWDTRKGRV